MNVTRIVVCLCLTLTCGTIEARTWKPVDKPAFSGDFLDIEGDNVRIQTVSGIEVIPYTSLSRTDKAVVKSNLQSKGRRDEASRLSQLDNGRKSETPPSESDESGQASTNSSPETSPSVPDAPPAGSRNWTDINGNRLQAEFVRVVGQNVELRVDGVTQTYPISGFGQADQQWLALQSQTGPGSEMPPGRSPGVPRMPGGDAGGNLPGSSMPGGGFPGSAYPGMRPSGPGFSGPGGAAGMPGGLEGMPNGPGGIPSGFPGGSPGMMDPGRSMAGAGGYPGGGGSPFGGAPGYQDPASGSQSSGIPSMPDYSGGGPGSFPGAASDFGGGGPSMPDSFGPPSMPPEMQPPGFASAPPTGFDLFENVLKCEDCGAEFPATSGLSEGDTCPKCSGGSSGTGFRFGRGAIKGIGFLVVVVAGIVGWIVKKVTGTA